MKSIFNTTLKRFILVIFISLVTIIISFFYYHIYTKYNIGIPCLFNKITNLYCPGCGITRAIFALLNLDINLAVRNNILIILTCVKKRSIIELRI